MPRSIFKKGQVATHARDTKGKTPSTPVKKPRVNGTGGVKIYMTIKDEYIQALIAMYPNLSLSLAARQYIIDHLEPYKESES